MSLRSIALQIVKGRPQVVDRSTITGASARVSSNSIDSTTYQVIVRLRSEGSISRNIAEDTRLEMHRLRPRMIKDLLVIGAIAIISNRLIGMISEGDRLAIMMRIAGGINRSGMRR